MSNVGSRIRARVAVVAALGLGAAGLTLVGGIAPAVAASAPLTYNCTQPDVFGTKKLDQAVTLDTNAAAEVAAGATVTPKVTAQITLHADTVGAMKLLRGADKISGGTVELAVNVDGASRNVTLAVDAIDLPFFGGATTVQASGSLGAVKAGDEGTSIVVEAGAVSKMNFELVAFFGLAQKDPLALSPCSLGTAGPGRVIDTIAVGAGSTDNPGNPDPTPVDLAYDCPVPVLGNKTFVSTTQIVSKGQVDPGATFDPDVKVNMTVPADLAGSMRSIMGAKSLGGTIVSTMTVAGQQRQVTITIPNGPVPDTGGFSLVGTGKVGPITAGNAGDWIQIVAGSQNVTMNLYKTTDSSDAPNPQVMTCSLGAGQDGLLANILVGSSAPSNPDPVAVDLTYTCDVPILGKQSFATSIHVKSKGQVDPGTSFDPEVAVSMTIPAGMADQLRGLIGAKVLEGTIQSTVSVNGTAREATIVVPRAVLPTSGGFALAGSGNLGTITAGNSGDWIQLIAGAQLVKMTYYKTADASDAPTERELPCTLNPGQDGLLANILVATAGTPPPPPPVVTPPVVVPPVTTTPTTPTTPGTTTPTTPATPGAGGAGAKTPVVAAKVGVKAVLKPKRAKNGSVTLRAVLKPTAKTDVSVTGKVTFTVTLKGGKGKITRSATVDAWGEATVKLSAKAVRKLTRGKKGKLKVKAAYAGSTAHEPVAKSATLRLR